MRCKLCNKDQRIKSLAKIEFITREKNFEIPALIEVSWTEYGGETVILYDL